MFEPSLVSNYARSEVGSYAVAVSIQQRLTTQLTELFATGCLCRKGGLNYGNLIQGMVLAWGKGQYILIANSLGKSFRSETLERKIK
tara:strand:- start:276 stop:536 length:261 start_codon:yes stop_codon:yes gene_type:complete